MVFSQKHWVFLGFLCVGISLSIADVERKVTTIFSPNCDEYADVCKNLTSEGANVVYSKATTPNHDDLHYIFSTIGVPTIIVVRTVGGDAQMHLNWKKLAEDEDDSIKFENTTMENFKIAYRFGVAFTKLIEYFDKDDNADLNYCQDHPPRCDFKVRDFDKHFIWEPLSGEATANKFVFNTTSDMFPSSESNNGTLTFTFVVRGSEGRASELPALKYHGNETQFDFVLDDYTPSYSKSRFALEAAFLSSSKPGHMGIADTTTIDDEYSPGVFKIVDWQDDHQQEKTTGFLQWKPVSYFGKNRGPKVSSQVKYYKLKTINDRPEDMAALNKSLLYPIFGPGIYTNPDFTLRINNISFGMSKDDFYNKNNYTGWSAAAGYGTPPKDNISAMVLIVISVGLGIPVLIIIFGGGYTVFRRMRGNSGYQAISSRAPNLQ